MAAKLSPLMGASEPVLAVTIRQLENASGHPGVDVHLLAEIIQKSLQKTAALGLDPHDTTNKELYVVLQNKVKQGNERLIEELGCTRSSAANDVLKCVVDAANALNIPKSCWAIKASVLKKMLKDLPPKNTMKYLGYKSIDSLLKRESIDVLLAAAHMLESTKWQRSFIDAIKKRGPHDFETRIARVVLLDEKRWGKAAAKYEALSHHNVMLLREAGVIAVLPLPITRLQGVAMVVLSLILHYINELRTFSSRARLQQVGSTTNNLSIANQPLHWRVVHQHFGAQPAANYPEAFGPYVQPEDLTWQAVPDILTNMHPELSFWQGLNYVGSHKEDNPVSFNVLDAAINFCNQLPFERRTTYYLQDDLHSELFRRYLREAPLQAELARQLDHNLNDEGSFGPLLEAWG